MLYRLLTAAFLCLFTVTAQAAIPILPNVEWQMAASNVVFEPQVVQSKDNLLPGYQLAQAPQEEVPPVVVIQTPPEDTTVEVEIGKLAAEWLPTLGYLIGAILMWAFRFLPGNVSFWFKLLRLDQVLQRSIDAAIARVVGAAKGKVWSIEVGNAVVATALEGFLASAPAWLVEWAGGKDGIVRKILARVSEFLPADFGDVAPKEVTKAAEGPKTQIDKGVEPVKATTNFVNKKPA